MPRGSGLTARFPLHHAEYQSGFLTEETRQPTWPPGLADSFKIFDACVIDILFVRWPPSRISRLNEATEWNPNLFKSWGAERVASDEVRFRLWATGQQRVTLRLSGKDIEMTPQADGWFETQVAGVAANAEYDYVLADGTAVPDPAARAQKAEVNGPSLVIDPDAYQWQNTSWKGRPWQESVVYELHIGTFTPEGTFRAAIEKLPTLAETGITMIEVLPVSQFGGNRGWGYDGVLLYAPHTAYGTPDDFKAFIDAAHGHGLSVVLDIVLNHFGPEGNYLPLLSPDFFHKARQTPWGAGIAYDVDAVRRYIVEAPLYWLQEFNLDGLRFDAIDQIDDPSDKHVLIDIAERIRASITDRPIHLTTEDCRNVTFLHPRDENGDAPLFTGEWNDDFHNAVHVLATGESHAYYQDFADQPEQRVARALAEGFVYQGEVSPQSGEPRGVKSSSQPPVAFVDFIQNHDQTGNRAQGERLISLAGAERTQCCWRCYWSRLIFRCCLWVKSMAKPGRSCSSPISTAIWPKRCVKVAPESLKAMPVTAKLCRIPTMSPPLNSRSLTGSEQKRRKVSSGWR